MVTFGLHVLLSFFCAEPLTVFALHGQSVLLFVYGSASICICLGLDRALPSSHVYYHRARHCRGPIAPSAAGRCQRSPAADRTEFSRLCGAPGVIRTRDPLLRSYAIQNSNCRFWCRLRGSASFISPLNWTEDGLKCWGEPRSDHCNELMLLAGVVTVAELSRVERKAPLG